MSIRNYYEEINSKSFKLELEQETLDEAIKKIKTIKREYKNKIIKNSKIHIEFKYL